MTSTTTAEAPGSAHVAWDPCGLPERAIADAGLDPATEQSTTVASSWEVKDCAWDAATRRYTVRLYSSANPFDRIQKNPAFEAFEPQTVGLRRALEFYAVDEDRPRPCWGAVEMPHDSKLIFTVRPVDPEGADVDLCAALHRHVSELEQYLPDM